MPTLQDARDDLDSLLKDGSQNLTSAEKLLHIKHAARRFSRKFPRIVAQAVDGDEGFEYEMPSAYVDGFSTITDVYFPWDPDQQNPTPLERKDWSVFDGPDGVRLRFKSSKPETTQDFLIVFTKPHEVSEDGLDTTTELDDAGTVVSEDGQTSAAVADTSVAGSIQIYINVTAITGTLSVKVQTRPSSDDDWVTIAQSNDIEATGENILPIDKKKISVSTRVLYVLSDGGSATLGTNLLQEGTAGTFTIQDHAMDALAFLAASISCQALADYYAGLGRSQLPGDTTDYEGKSTFWKENSSGWYIKWEDAAKELSPQRGVSAFGQGDWDLKGTTGFEFLTHAEDDR